MLHLIKKYGFTLGFRIWRLRRKAIRRNCTAVTAFDLRAKARRQDRRRNPVAAEILRSIANEIRPTS